MREEETHNFEVCPILNKSEFSVRIICTAEASYVCLVTQKGQNLVVRCDTIDRAAHTLEIAYHLICEVLWRITELQPYE